MSERNAWLFATIAHAFTAVSCIGLCIYRLTQSRKLTPTLFLHILNAVLWPVTFTCSLLKFLSLNAREAAEAEG